MNLNQTLQEKYPHLEVSVLRLSEVQKDNEKDRIDAEFFSKNFIVAYQKIKNMNYLPLYECLELLTDYHANGSYELLNSNVTLRDTKDYAYMIRTTDLEKMDFENEVKYISKHAYNFLSKTKVFGGEVVINKIGKPGASYFIPFLNKPISLGMNLFLLRTNDKLNSAFLYIFLNTNLGKIIIERKVNGAVPQTIDKEAIKSLPIPILPMEFQLEIEKMVKDSHKALEESKELYKKAEEILYLELGIDPKNPLQSLLDSKTNNPTKSPNISIRTLKESFLKTGRLDSEYYQSKYEDIEKFIKSYPNGYDSFSNIINNKYTNFTPKNNENYNYIELANIGNNGNISEPISDLGKNLPTRARRIVSKGDVIISSIEGSLSSCALITQEFDKHLVSTGFFILNSKLLNGETLLVMFKSQIFQEYLKKFPSGTILCAINKEELSKILIPIIDPTTQEKIANHIQESFKLRTEAKALLEDAKAQVEFAINRGGGD
ncbi:restriction endonuclease subunit S [Campylobacter armoricus]|uniref:restriction endonuclease subunit S n=1 Tax=Campylobacter armoricus TaxID=2505970 RepID=UPI001117AA91|nr:restriction endonuclease subunit S [Campylobacter armoricus]